MESFFVVVYGVHVVGLCCLGCERGFSVLVWIDVCWVCGR